MSDTLHRTATRAKIRAFERLKAAADGAVGSALSASLAGYDRSEALARFHRLPIETILSETPESAREVLREIERAMRAERARKGHWSTTSIDTLRCSSRIAPKPNGWRDFSAKQGLDATGALFTTPGIA